MSKRIARNTIELTTPPSVAAYASVVGKKEGEGPLAEHFDVVCDDTTFGEQTWEKAESRMQKDAASKALIKAGLSPADIDVLFAGDLLNQGIASTFGLRDLDIPFVGLYGACSTMAESLAMAALFVDNSLALNTMAITSSHFCSAERQFRLPLEYGGQRTPTAQWTATASGAVVLNTGKKAPFIRAVTIGKIQDLGIKDTNNMGAAMAPAAYDTILQHLSNSSQTPESFDLILTGDLGQVGTDLLRELLMRDGIDISQRHNDCGLMIYDRARQDVHAGGSGCGCSASVLCGYILKQVESGALKDVLFVATGALMSPTSTQQGESIPGIAHAVHISNTAQ